MRRRFSESYATGYHRSKNFVWEMLSDFLHDILRKVRAPIIHCEQHPADSEFGKEPTFNARQRFHELRQPFQGKVLALNGDDDAIRCGKQAVKRQQAE